jgi:hypothetical protein
MDEELAADYTEHAKKWSATVAAATIQHYENLISVGFDDGFAAVLTRDFHGGLISEIFSPVFIHDDD